MQNLVHGEPDRGDDGADVDDDAHQLAVVDEEQAQEVEEDATSITMGTSVGKDFWCGDMSDNS